MINPSQILRTRFLQQLKTPDNNGNLAMLQERSRFSSAKKKRFPSKYGAGKDYESNYQFPNPNDYLTRTSRSPQSHLLADSTVKAIKDFKRNIQDNETNNNNYNLKPQPSPIPFEWGNFTSNNDTYNFNQLKPIPFEWGNPLNGSKSYNLKAQLTPIPFEWGNSTSNKNYNYNPVKPVSVDWGQSLNSSESNNLKAQPTHIPFEWKGSLESNKSYNVNPLKPIQFSWGKDPKNDDQGSNIVSSSITDGSEHIITESPILTAIDTEDKDYIAETEHTLKKSSTKKENMASPTTSIDFVTEKKEMLASLQEMQPFLAGKYAHLMTTITSVASSPRTSSTTTKENTESIIDNVFENMNDSSWKDGNPAEAHVKITTPDVAILLSSRMGLPATPQSQEQDLEQEERHKVTDEFGDVAGLNLNTEATSTKPLYLFTEVVSEEELDSDYSVKVGGASTITTPNIEDGTEEYDDLENPDITLTEEYDNITIQTTGTAAADVEADDSVFENAFNDLNKDQGLGEFSEESTNLPEQKEYDEDVGNQSTGLENKTRTEVTGNLESTSIIEYDEEEELSTTILPIGTQNASYSKVTIFLPLVHTQTISAQSHYIEDILSQSYSTTFTEGNENHDLITVDSAHERISSVSTLHNISASTSIIPEELERNETFTGGTNHTPMGLEATETGYLLEVSHSLLEFPTTEILGETGRPTQYTNILSSINAFKETSLAEEFESSEVLINPTEEGLAVPKEFPTTDILGEAGRSTKYTNILSSINAFKETSSAEESKASEVLINTTEEGLAVTKEPFEVEQEAMKSTKVHDQEMIPVVIEAMATDHYATDVNIFLTNMLQTMEENELMKTAQTATEAHSTFETTNSEDLGHHFSSSLNIFSTVAAPITVEISTPYLKPPHLEESTILKELEIPSQYTHTSEHGTMSKPFIDQMGKDIEQTTIKHTNVHESVSTLFPFAQTFVPQLERATEIASLEFYSSNLVDMDQLKNTTLSYVHTKPTIFINDSVDENILPKIESMLKIFSSTESSEDEETVDMELTIPSITKFLTSEKSIFTHHPTTITSNVSGIGGISESTNISVADNINKAFPLIVSIPGPFEDHTINMTIEIDQTVSESLSSIGTEEPMATWPSKVSTETTNTFNIVSEIEVPKFSGELNSDFSNHTIISSKTTNPVLLEMITKISVISLIKLNHTFETTPLPFSTIKSELLNNVHNITEGTTLGLMEKLFTETSQVGEIALSPITNPENNIEETKGGIPEAHLMLASNDLSNRTIISSKTTNPVLSKMINTISVTSLIKLNHSIETTPVPISTIKSELLNNFHNITEATTLGLMGELFTATLQDEEITMSPITHPENNTEETKAGIPEAHLMVTSNDLSNRTITSSKTTNPALSKMINTISVTSLIKLNHTIETTPISTIKSELLNNLHNITEATTLGLMGELFTATLQDEEITMSPITHPENNTEETKAGIPEAHLMVTSNDLSNRTITSSKTINPVLSEMISTISVISLIKLNHSFETTPLPFSTIRSELLNNFDNITEGTTLGLMGELFTETSQDEEITLSPITNPENNTEETKAGIPEAHLILTSLTFSEPNDVNIPIEQTTRSSLYSLTFVPDLKNASVISAQEFHVPVLEQENDNITEYMDMELTTCYAVNITSNEEFEIHSSQVLKENEQSYTNDTSTTQMLHNKNISITTIHEDIQVPILHTMKEETFGVNLTTIIQMEYSHTTSKDDSLKHISEKVTSADLANFPILQHINITNEGLQIPTLYTVKEELEAVHSTLNIQGGHIHTTNKEQSQVYSTETTSDQPHDNILSTTTLLSQLPYVNITNEKAFGLPTLPTIMVEVSSSKMEHSHTTSKDDSLIHISEKVTSSDLENFQILEHINVTNKGLQIPTLYTVKEELEAVHSTLNIQGGYIHATSKEHSQVYSIETTSEQPHDNILNTTTLLPQFPYVNITNENAFGLSTIPKIIVAVSSEMGHTNGATSIQEPHVSSFVTRTEEPHEQSIAHSHTLQEGNMHLITSGQGVQMTTHFINDSHNEEINSSSITNTHVDHMSTTIGQTSPFDMMGKQISEHFNASTTLISEHVTKFTNGKEFEVATIQTIGESVGVISTSVTPHPKGEQVHTSSKQEYATNSLGLTSNRTSGTLLNENISGMEIVTTTLATILDKSSEITHVNTLAANVTNEISKIATSGDVDEWGNKHLDSSNTTPGSFVSDLMVHISHTHDDRITKLDFITLVPTASGTAKAKTKTDEEVEITTENNENLKSKITDSYSKSQFVDEEAYKHTHPNITIAHKITEIDVNVNLGQKSTLCHACEIEDEDMTEEYSLGTPILSHISVSTDGVGINISTATNNLNYAPHSTSLDESTLYEDSTIIVENKVADFSKPIVEKIESSLMASTSHLQEITHNEHLQTTHSALNGSYNIENQFVSITGNHITSVGGDLHYNLMNFSSQHKTTLLNEFIVNKSFVEPSAKFVSSTESHMTLEEDATYNLIHSSSQDKTTLCKECTVGEGKHITESLKPVVEFTHVPVQSTIYFEKTLQNTSSSETQRSTIIAEQVGHVVSSTESHMRTLQEDLAHNRTHFPSQNKIMLSTEFISGESFAEPSGKFASSSESHVVTLVEDVGHNLVHSSFQDKTTLCKECIVEEGKHITESLKPVLEFTHVPVQSTIYFEEIMHNTSSSETQSSTMIINQVGHSTSSTESHMRTLQEDLAYNRTHFPSQNKIMLSTEFISGKSFAEASGKFASSSESNIATLVEDVGYNLMHFNPQDKITLCEECIIEGGKDVTETLNPVVEEGKHITESLKPVLEFTHVPVQSTIYFEETMHNTSSSETQSSTMITKQVGHFASSTESHMRTLQEDLANNRTHFPSQNKIILSTEFISGKSFAEPSGKFASSSESHIATLVEDVGHNLVHSSSQDKTTLCKECTVEEGKHITESLKPVVKFTHVPVQSTIYFEETKHNTSSSETQRSTIIAEQVGHVASSTESHMRTLQEDLANNRTHFPSQNKIILSTEFISGKSFAEPSGKFASSSESHIATLVEDVGHNLVHSSSQDKTTLCKECTVEEGKHITESLKPVVEFTHVPVQSTIYFEETKHNTSSSETQRSTIIAEQVGHVASSTESHMRTVQEDLANNRTHFPSQNKIILSTEFISGKSFAEPSGKFASSSESHIATLVEDVGHNLVHSSSQDKTTLCKECTVEEGKHITESLKPVVKFTHVPVQSTIYFEETKHNTSSSETQRSTIIAEQVGHVASSTESHMRTLQEDLANNRTHFPSQNKIILSTEFISGKSFAEPSGKFASSSESHIATLVEDVGHNLVHSSSQDKTTLCKECTVEEGKHITESLKPVFEFTHVPVQSTIYFEETKHNTSSSETQRSTIIAEQVGHVASSTESHMRTVQEDLANNRTHFPSQNKIILSTEFISGKSFAEPSGKFASSSESHIATLVEDVGHNLVHSSSQDKTTLCKECTVEKGKHITESLKPVVEFTHVPVQSTIYFEETKHTSSSETQSNTMITKQVGHFTSNTESHMRTLQEDLANNRTHFPSQNKIILSTEFISGKSFAEPSGKFASSSESHILTLVEDVGHNLVHSSSQDKTTLCKECTVEEGKHITESLKPVVEFTHVPVQTAIDFEETTHNTSSSETQRSTIIVEQVEHVASSTESHMRTAQEDLAYNLTHFPYQNEIMFSTEFNSGKSFAEPSGKFASSSESHIVTLAEDVGYNLMHFDPQDKITLCEECTIEGGKEVTETLNPVIELTHVPIQSSSQFQETLTTIFSTEFIIGINNANESVKLVSSTDSHVQNDLDTPSHNLILSSSQDKTYLCKDCTVNEGRRITESLKPVIELTHIPVRSLHQFEETSNTTASVESISRTSITKESAKFVSSTESHIVTLAEDVGHNLMHSSSKDKTTLCKECTVEEGKHITESLKHLGSQDKTTTTTTLSAEFSSDKSFAEPGAKFASSTKSIIATLEEDVGHNLMHFSSQDKVTLCEECAIEGGKEITESSELVIGVTRMPIKSLSTTEATMNTTLSGESKSIAQETEIIELLKSSVTQGIEDHSLASTSLIELLYEKSNHVVNITTKKSEPQNIEAYLYHSTANNEETFESPEAIIIISETTASFQSNTNEQSQNKTKLNPLNTKETEIYSHEISSSETTIELNRSSSIEQEESTENILPANRTSELACDSECSDEQLIAQTLSTLDSQSQFSQSSSKSHVDLTFDATIYSDVVYDTSTMQPTSDLLSTTATYFDNITHITLEHSSHTLQSMPGKTGTTKETNDHITVTNATTQEINVTMIEFTMPSIYVNLPTYFPNSTEPIPNFENYYTPKEKIVDLFDDEQKDTTINIDLFRSMKLTDFYAITEFPVSTEITTVSCSNETCLRITTEDDLDEARYTTSASSNGDDTITQSQINYTRETESTSLCESNNTCEIKNGSSQIKSSIASSETVLDIEISTVSQDLAKTVKVSSEIKTTMTCNELSTCETESDVFQSKSSDLVSSKKNHMSSLPSANLEARISTLEYIGSEIITFKTNTEYVHTIPSEIAETTSYDIGTIITTVEISTATAENSAITSANIDNVTESIVAAIEDTTNTFIEYDDTSTLSPENETVCAIQEVSGAKAMDLNMQLATPISVDRNDSQCPVKDYNASKTCMCSIDVLLKDLKQKTTEREFAESIDKYLCNSFVPINKGIKLGNQMASQIPRSRRSKREMSETGEIEVHKRDVIQNAEISRALEIDFQIRNTDKQVYAPPGGEVKIPCAPPPLESATGTWKFNGKSLTDGKVVEGNGFITVDTIVPQDGGNYTCTDMHGLQHVHKLSVITLPFFIVNASILYEVNDRCEEKNADLLQKYLSNDLSDMLCGSEHKICNMVVHNTHCLHKGSKDYLETSIELGMEPLEIIMPSLNKSDCDITCQLKLYSKMVGILVKNLDIFQIQTVYFNASAQESMILRPIDAESNADNEGTSASKLIISCSPGFGLITGSHICEACLPNTYSAGDEAFCADCPPATYQPSAGSKSCLICSNIFDDILCARGILYEGSGFTYMIALAGSLLILLLVGLGCSLSKKNEPKDRTECNQLSRKRRKRRRTDPDIEKQDDHSWRRNSRRRSSKEDGSPIAPELLHS